MRAVPLTCRAIFGVALFSLGCGGDAKPRPQWLVIVDTDLPLVGELADKPTVSAAVAMDTLLLEVLRADGTLLDTFEARVSDRLDWPVSFGVVPTEARRVRMRLFRSRDARRAADGHFIVNPAVSVDRLVALSVPTQKTPLRVTLRGACLGRKPTFGTPGETCVDETLLSGPPDAGLEVVESEQLATQAGTWKDAFDAPCASAGPEGTVCIPGGFSFLGDDTLGGFADGALVKEEALPMRLVRLSPFHMDRTELSVAEFRSVLPLLTLEPGELPIEQATTGTFANCSFAKQPGSGEELPLNCLRPSLAKKVCAARGGSLPTEAQWEHAARGRGQGRRFVWGEASPKCCTGALSRVNSTGMLECGGAGYDAVSTLPSEGCAQRDLSRDGVLNLGGNVSELTRDTLVAYGEGCWAGTVPLLDPACEKGGDLMTVRGADITRPLSLTQAALRSFFPLGGALPNVGFRCVYP